MAKKQATDDPDFDTFWAVYPRATDKADARRAWDKARKEVSAIEILAGLGAYPFDANPRFVPMPATWLNKQRWVPAVIRPAPTQAASASRLSWRDKYDGGPAPLVNGTRSDVVTIDVEAIPQRRLI